MPRYVGFVLGTSTEIVALPTPIVGVPGPIPDRPIAEDSLGKPEVPQSRRGSAAISFRSSARCCSQRPMHRLWHTFVCALSCDRLWHLIGVFSSLFRFKHGRKPAGPRCRNETHLCVARRRAVRAMAADSSASRGASGPPSSHTRKKNDSRASSHVQTCPPTPAKSGPRLLQEALSASIAAGTEGLIVKSLSSKYAPGKRSMSWLKLKKDDSLGVGMVDKLVNYTALVN